MQSAATTLEQPPVKLSGEGDVEIIERTRVRVECENCGEPADQRHTYLLPNARRNPQSSAYGHDDCSWCSDREIFSCGACRDAEWRGCQPRADGYEWCSTFSVGPRFAHLFLRWAEKKLPVAPAVAPDLMEILKPFIEIWDRGGPNYADKMSRYWDYDNLSRARAAIAKAEGAQ